MAKRLPKRRLPKPHGPSGQLFGVACLGYTVGSWCPTPDGSGPPEAVAFTLHTKLDGKPCDFMLRLKTPEAVDILIQALLRHKRDVWPDSH